MEPNKFLADFSFFFFWARRFVKNVVLSLLTEQSPKYHPPVKHYNVLKLTNSFRKKNNVIIFTINKRSFLFLASNIQRFFFFFMTYKNIPIQKTRIADKKHRQEGRNCKKTHRNRACQLPSIAQQSRFCFYRL